MLSNHGVSDCQINNVHKRNRLDWCNARVNWNHNQRRQVFFLPTSQLLAFKGNVDQCGCTGDLVSDTVLSVLTRGTGREVPNWWFWKNSPTHCSRKPDPHVLPYLNANPGTIFMQDNATPHAARLTTAHLNNHNVHTLPWPSKSPDFNPIEHLWDVLDQDIKKRPNQPRTLAELRHALKEELQRFPQYKIRRLISSMQRRCQACIAARGGHTRYWSIK